MKNNGFTLIELLAIIAILIIILLIAIPIIMQTIGQIRQKTFETNKQVMEKATKVYLADYENIAPQTIGNFTIISLATLIDDKYVSDIFDPKSHQPCDYVNSNVRVTKISTKEYSYTSVLICDNYTDEVIAEDDFIDPTYILSKTTSNSGTVYAYDDYGIYFDGINDYVEIPRSIQGDFTIEFQFRSLVSGIGTSTDWWYGAGLVDAETITQKYDFGTSINANGQVLAATGNPDTFLYSQMGYDKNVKHSVRFTRTAATGELKLYVDNVLIQTATGTTADLTDSNTINFGKIRQRTNYFRGYISNVRLWDIVTSSNMDTDLTGNESGLQAYYKFDEGTGSTLNDYSVNENTGTLYGSPSWIVDNSGIRNISIYSGNVIDNYSGLTPLLRTTTSSLNYTDLTEGDYTVVIRDRGNNETASILYIGSNTDSIYFDGINDYVNIPRSITDSFTIEFQFKSPSGGIGTGTAWYTGAGLVDAEVNGYTNDFGTSINSYGKVLFGTGSPDTYLTSATGYNQDIWHDFRLTRDKTTGELKLYLDGVLAKTGTGGTASLTAPANINIGRLRIGSNYFKGYIKNVRLWDKVTSSDMGAQLTGSESGLKAYYKFDEGSGTTLTDYSTNGNNGTIYGSPVWN